MKQAADGRGTTSMRIPLSEPIASANSGSPKKVLVCVCVPLYGRSIEFRWFRVWTQARHGIYGKFVLRLYAANVLGVLVAVGNGILRNVRSHGKNRKVIGDE